VTVAESLRPLIPLNQPQIRALTAQHFQNLAVLGKRADLQAYSFLL
jgi:hypothetical protein